MSKSKDNPSGNERLKLSDIEFSKGKTKLTAQKTNIDKELDKIEESFKNSKILKRSRKGKEVPKELQDAREAYNNNEPDNFLEIISELKEKYSGNELAEQYDLGKNNNKNIAGKLNRIKNAVEPRMSELNPEKGELGAAASRALASGEAFSYEFEEDVFAEKDHDLAEAEISSESTGGSNASDTNAGNAAINESELNNSRAGENAAVANGASAENSRNAAEPSVQTSGNTSQDKAEDSKIEAYDSEIEAYDSASAYDSDSSDGYYSADSGGENIYTDYESDSSEEAREPEINYSSQVNASSRDQEQLIADYDFETESSSSIADTSEESTSSESELGSSSSETSEVSDIKIGDAYVQNTGRGWFRNEGENISESIDEIEEELKNCSQETRQSLKDLQNSIVKNDGWMVNSNLQIFTEKLITEPEQNISADKKKDIAERTNNINMALSSLAEKQMEDNKEFRPDIGKVKLDNDKNTNLFWTVKNAGPYIYGSSIDTFNAYENMNDALSEGDAVKLQKSLGEFEQRVSEDSSISDRNKRALGNITGEIDKGISSLYNIGVIEDKDLIRPLSKTNSELTSKEKEEKSKNIDEVSSQPENKQKNESKIKQAYTALKDSIFSMFSKIRETGNNIWEKFKGLKDSVFSAFSKAKTNQKEFEKTKQLQSGAANSLGYEMANRQDENIQLNQPKQGNQEVESAPKAQPEQSERGNLLASIRQQEGKVPSKGNKQQTSQEPPKNFLEEIRKQGGQVPNNKTSTPAAETSGSQTKNKSRGSGSPKRPEPTSAMKGLLGDIKKKGQRQAAASSEKLASEAGAPEGGKTQEASTSKHGQEQETSQKSQPKSPLMAAIEARGGKTAGKIPEKSSNQVGNSQKSSEIQSTTGQSDFAKALNKQKDKIFNKGANNSAATEEASAKTNYQTSKEPEKSEMQKMIESGYNKIQNKKKNRQKQKQEKEQEQEQVFDGEQYRQLNNSSLAGKEPKTQSAVSEQKPKLTKQEEEAERQRTEKLNQTLAGRRQAVGGDESDSETELSSDDERDNYKTAIKNNRQENSASKLGVSAAAEKNIKTREPATTSERDASNAVEGQAKSTAPQNKLGVEVALTSMLNKGGFGTESDSSSSDSDSDSESDNEKAKPAGASKAKSKRSHSSGRRRSSKSAKGGARISSGLNRALEQKKQPY